MLHLKDQIAVVEKLRGVGRDGKLRLAGYNTKRFIVINLGLISFSGDLENLEHLLAATKSKKCDT